MEEKVGSLVDELRKLVARLDDVTTGLGATRAPFQGKSTGDPDNFYDPDKEQKSRDDKLAETIAEENEKTREKPRTIMAKAMPVSLVNIDKAALKQLKSIVPVSNKNITDVKSARNDDNSLPGGLGILLGMGIRPFLGLYKIFSKLIKAGWFLKLTKLLKGKSLTGVFRSVYNLTTRMLGKLIPKSVSTFVKNLGPLMKKQWSTFRRFINGLNLKRLIPNSIRNWWSKFNFKGKWIDFKSWIKSFRPTSLIPASIRKWWSGLKWATKWSGFKTWFVDLPTKITGLIPQPVRTALTSTVELMKKALKPVTTMLAGIGSLFGGDSKSKVSIFTKIGNLFNPKTNPVVSKALGFLKIGGKLLLKVLWPITLLLETFNFITGFMEGYQRDGIIGGIRDGVNKVFNSIVAFPLNLLKDGVSWLLEKMGFSEASKILDQFTFTDLFGRLFDGLGGLITYAIDSISSIVDEGMESVKDIFRSEEEIAARKAAGERSTKAEAAMKDVVGDVISADALSVMIQTKKDIEQAQGDSIGDLAEGIQDALRSSGKFSKTKEEFKVKFEKELDKADLDALKDEMGDDYDNMLQRQFKNIENIKSSGRRGRDLRSAAGSIDSEGVYLANMLRAEQASDKMSETLTNQIKQSGKFTIGEKDFYLPDITQSNSSYELMDKYEMLLKDREQTQDEVKKRQLSMLIDSLDDVGVGKEVDRLRAELQSNQQYMEAALKSEELYKAGDKNARKEFLEKYSPQQPLKIEPWLKEELGPLTYKLPPETGFRKQPEFDSGGMTPETRARITAINALGIDTKYTQDTSKRVERQILESTKPVTDIVPMTENKAMGDQIKGKHDEYLKLWDIEGVVSPLDISTGNDEIKKAGDTINSGAKKLNETVGETFPKPNSPHAWQYLKMAGENINTGSKMIYDQSLEYKQISNKQQSETGKQNKELNARVNNMVEIMRESAEIQKKTLKVLSDNGLTEKPGDTLVNNGGNTTNINNVTTTSDITTFRDRVVGRLYSK